MKRKTTWKNYDHACKMGMDFIWNKYNGNHEFEVIAVEKELLTIFYKSSDGVWYTDKFTKEVIYNTCNLCLEQPAIQGESLCEECKKTNQE